MEIIKAFVAPHAWATAMTRTRRACWVAGVGRLAPSERSWWVRLDMRITPPGDHLTYWRRGPIFVARMKSPTPGETPS